MILEYDWAKLCSANPIIMPLVSVYTLWKHHRTSGFLMFSGDIERTVTVHELKPFLAPLMRQNITWSFSNLRVSTFEKSMMGFWIDSFFPKIEVFYRPEWTKGESAWKWILTIFKYKKKRMLQTVNTEKLFEKMGSFI